MRKIYNWKISTFNEVQKIINVFFINTSHQNHNDIRMPLVLIAPMI